MSSSSIPPPQNNPSPQIKPPAESGSTNLSMQDWLMSAKSAIAHEQNEKEEQIEQKMAAFVKENQLGDHDPQVQHALFYIQQNRGPSTVADLSRTLETDTSFTRINAAIQSINDTDPNGPQFPMLR